MILHKGLILLVGLALVVGCSSKPKLSQLSGKVTFKGKPVPAGYLTFTQMFRKAIWDRSSGFRSEKGNTIHRKMEIRVYLRNVQGDHRRI